MDWTGTNTGPLTWDQSNPRGGRHPYRVRGGCAHQAVRNGKGIWYRWSLGRCELLPLLASKEFRDQLPTDKSRLQLVAIGNTGYEAATAPNHVRIPLAPGAGRTESKAGPRTGDGTLTSWLILAIDHRVPHGQPPPPAMQPGNYNCRTYVKKRLREDVLAEHATARDLGTPPIDWAANSQRRQRLMELYLARLVDHAAPRTRAWSGLFGEH